MKREIVRWLKRQLKQSGCEGFVIGLSGGIDSSVVAALCKEATPNVLGVIMPCDGNPLDKEHAELFAKKFNIESLTWDISKEYQSMLEDMNGFDNRTTTGNIKARLRMTVLYMYANVTKYMVAGTGNLSEILTGYLTKYGDGGVDIEPIGHLFKTDVIKMAKRMGIPKKIINKPPSAGLYEGQTDEKEMGISYKELDKALKYFLSFNDIIDFNDIDGVEYMESEAFTEAQKVTIQLAKKSVHKRRMPPTPETRY